MELLINKLLGQTLIILQIHDFYALSLFKKLFCLFLVIQWDLIHSKVHENLEIIILIKIPILTKIKITIQTSKNVHMKTLIITFHYR